MLVIGTLIRHASPSGTVTAISGGMHGATTRSCLIASPSFPLVVVPGFLRAGSDAVDLTSIAPPTDEDLRAAASTQKHPATRFIGRVRHTNPRTGADCSRLQPRSDQACRRARSCQGAAWRRRSVPLWPERRPTLTASARAGVRNLRSGRKKACGAVEQKKAQKQRKKGLDSAPAHIIPIAPAAPPVPNSRDFVPWRFSDAGRRSAWIASSCRRPKTCTKADINCRDCGVRSLAGPEPIDRSSSSSSTCCARPPRARPKPSASQSAKSSEHLRPTECANYFRNSGYAQS